MCRYGFIAYKNTYACFRCRKGFKRRLDIDLLSQKELRIEKQKKFDKLIYKRGVARKKANDTLLVRCPDCRGQIVNLGKDLRLPKKDKQEEWLAIEYLANKPLTFLLVDAMEQVSCHRICRRPTGGWKSEEVKQRVKNC